MKRRKKTTTPTRLPDDTRAIIAKAAALTGWSVNQTTAKLIRLGDAALHEQSDAINKHFSEIMLAVRAKQIRDAAEKRIQTFKQRKWNPVAPAKFNGETPPF